MAMAIRWKLKFGNGEWQWKTLSEQLYINIKIALNSGTGEISNLSIGYRKLVYQDETDSVQQTNQILNQMACYKQ